MTCEQCGQKNKRPQLPTFYFTLKGLYGNSV